MKKAIIILTTVCLAACKAGSDNEEARRADSLAVANQELSQQVRQTEGQLESKEAAVVEFLKAFNEIEANLAEIKAKEKGLTITKNAELKQSTKDQIISDIKFIYEQMNKNKRRLASLNKQLKNSNIQVEELQQATANLNQLLVDRQTEIETLRSSLAVMSIDLAIIKTLYIEEGQELDAKTQQLNTAFYAVGSTKELEKKGIVKMDGGVIGIGKTAELNSNAEDARFQKIDITEVKEIPLYKAKKVKLVTPHPDSSYKLEMGATKKIVILDAEAFWKNSKYLVVTTE